MFIIPTLSQKLVKVKQQKGQQVVEINFKSSEEHQKFLSCYQLLLPRVHVPLMLHQNSDTKTVTSVFVSNIPHETNDPLYCLRLVQLCRSISSIPLNKKDCPRYDCQMLIKMVEKSLESWRNYTDSSLPFSPQMEFLLKEFKKFQGFLDSMPSCTIYRDLNLTNILRSSSNDELYLVDFESICEGPYITDLVFLTNDKYFYIEQTNVRKMLSWFYENIAREKQIQRAQFEKHWRLTSFYQCVRWLFLMVGLSFSKNTSFHMHLITLCAQIYRSCGRMRHDYPTFIFEKLHQICLIIISDFMKGYARHHHVESLPALPASLTFEKGNGYSIQPENSHQLVFDWDELMEQKKKKRSQLFSQQLNGKENSELTMQQMFDAWELDLADKEKELIADLINKIGHASNQNVKIINCGEKPISILSQIFNIIPHCSMDDTPSTHDLKQTDKGMSQKSEEVVKNGKSFTAIILAAGKGSRLGYRHKAMIKVGEKTLLEHWLQKIKEFGITEVIISDLKNRVNITKKICSPFTSQLNISYLEFEQPLESGRTVIELVRKVETKFTIIISCDTFTNFNLSELHFDSESLAGSILAAPQSQNSNYVQNSADNCLGVKNKSQSINEAVNVTYGGLGAFVTEKLLDCEIRQVQKYPFGSVLDKVLESWKVKVVRLKPGNYMFNINREEDMEAAMNFWKKI